MTTEQRREWLLNSALTAAWAAVIWAVTYLAYGAGAEISDARTFQREKVVPALQEARASANMADSALAVVGRVERRTALLASHVGHPGTPTRQALRDTARVVASLAYTLVDSSLADSALLASFEGAPLDAQGRWYLTSTLRFLGLEAAYLTEISTDYWDRARPVRRGKDHEAGHLNLTRRYQVAYAGFLHNSDVALAGSRSRVAALAQENEQLGAKVQLIKVRYYFAGAVLVLAIVVLPWLMRPARRGPALGLVRPAADARAA